MPRLSDLNDNPDEVKIVEEAGPARLANLTGGDDRQVTFVDDKGIAVEHPASASDRYTKESMASVYSGDVYPSVAEQDKISFTQAMGAKFYMGLQSSARNVGRLMFLDRIPYFKGQYELQEQEEALARQELGKQSGVSKFASDFSEGVGGMVYTLPVDMMAGGVTKVLLAGKVLPSVSRYMVKIPDFAVGMGTRGFVQKTEEGKSLEAPLSAAEQAAIGMLYGSVGTGWRSYPKMSSLGLAEAHYNALKQNRLATREEAIEGAANGLAFATVFHAIGAMEKGMSNAREKGVLQESQKVIDEALKSGDLGTVKDVYERLIVDERISPESRAAILGAFKDTREAYINSEKGQGEDVYLSKEESRLLESAIAKHATNESLVPEEEAVINKIMNKGGNEPKRSGGMDLEAYARESMEYDTPESFAEENYQRVFRYKFDQQRMKSAHASAIKGKYDLGTVGDFIIDDKLREQFADVLNVPVRSNNELPENNPARLVAYQPGNAKLRARQAAAGTPSSVIEMGPAIWRGGAEENFLHEVIHAQRNFKGRGIGGEAEAAGELSATKGAAFFKESVKKELVDIWNSARAGGKVTGQVSHPSDAELGVYKNNLKELMIGASDQAHISDLPVEIANQRKIPRAIYIDRKIVDKIEGKHGLTVDESFIDNLNNSDFMVFYKDAPKINFVKKLGNNKTLVVSVKRYNGHFVITGFESPDPTYAESLKKRGEVVNLTGRAAVPSSVPAEPSRPASLSGVSKTSTSPDKNIPQPGKRVNVKDVMPDASGVTPLQRQIQSLEERQARVESAQYALDDIDTIRQGFMRRIRRYKDEYLKEELTGIPKEYITKKGGITPDEAIQELRDHFGVEVADETGLKEYLKNLEDTRKSLLEEIRRNRPQMITKRETTLLKDRIKATEQGIKEGRLKTKQEIESIQNEVIDAIEQADLPLDERAKFIRTIKNVQTRADLARTFPDIAKRLQESKTKQVRQEIINELQRAAERANRSGGIAVEYADMIGNILKQIEFQGHRPETIESLKNTRKFIEKSLAAGKDVEMPEEILKQLKILEKKPASDLSEGELEDLLNTVEDLENMGRAKLRLRQMAEEQRKAQALADIIQDSDPLFKKEKVEAEAGERLNVYDKLKNRYADARNFLMEKDIAIAPMDVIFDLLDGKKQYKGANSRIFKQTLNREFGKYLEMKDKAEKEVRELARRLKLDDRNFERIGVYAAKMQEGGYEKLLSSGHTEREIERDLSPEEMQLYSLMRDKLESFRPEISEIMRLVYNEPFHAVKNYFPFMTDFNKMSDSEIRARFGDNVEQYGLAPRKNVSRGFTKKRQGKKQKIQINAMEVFLKHVDNASYFVTVGKETKFLGELAAKEEYAEAVGELGQEIVRDWIDLVARKGKISGEANSMLDGLRKHAGASILAFRLSSALIQPTSIITGAGLIGKYAFDGAFKIAADGRWRRFVRENMPEVKHRVGDDPGFLEFGDKNIVDKAEQVGFWALERLDGIAAASVAAGAYEKYCKEHGIEVDLDKPNQEAIDYAQLMMRRSQSSSFFIDAPSALTRGTFSGKGGNALNKSIDKAIFQFQSFMLNDWSMVRHDLWRAGIVEKRMGQAANIFFWLTLVFLAQTGIRGGTRALVSGILNKEPDPDEENTWHKVINNVFLQQIPFVGNAVQAWDYGSNPIPALEFLNKFARDMSSAKKSKDMDRKLLALARGIALWLPGGSNLEPLLKIKKNTEEL